MDDEQPPVATTSVLSCTAVKKCDGMLLDFICDNNAPELDWRNSAHDWFPTERMSSFSPKNRAWWMSISVFSTTVFVRLGMCQILMWPKLAWGFPSACFCPPPPATSHESVASVLTLLTQGLLVGFDFESKMDKKERDLPLRTSSTVLRTYSSIVNRSYIVPQIPTVPSSEAVRSSFDLGKYEMSCK